MSQNQAKSNDKDCSLGDRDSFVKGTRLSILILAKSQADRKFEVLKEPVSPKVLCVLVLLF